MSDLATEFMLKYDELADLYGEAKARQLLFEFTGASSVIGVPDLKLATFIVLADEHLEEESIHARLHFGDSQ